MNTRKKPFDTSNEFLSLKVNVRKNQSLSKGGVSRGPQIGLIFTYFVVFHADSRGVVCFS